MSGRGAVSRFDHVWQYDAEMALRLPSQRSIPIGFAHRGARAHVKESTSEAFDLAVKLGASGIQSDVWLSSDGHLMLHHDAHVGLRRRQIRSTDRSALPETMISLPELLARVPESVEISIGMRDDDAMDSLIAWAASIDPVTRSRLYLCHQDWRRLAEWRAADEHIQLVDATNVGAMSEGPERRASNLAEAGINAVMLRHSEWTGGMATLFHRFGRLCFGWDAQHRRILDDLLRMGLDGVYSDHVDTMMEAIDQRPPPPTGGVKL